MARVLLAGASLVAGVAPAGAACNRFQQGQGGFTTAAGGLVKPGTTTSGCAYHQHELSCGAGAISRGATITMKPPSGSTLGSYGPILELSASPSSPPVTFGGALAGLRVEYRASDVPAVPGNPAPRMRAWASCTQANPSPYCMPDADPSEDLAAHTVTTAIGFLPKQAAAFVTVSHLDTPAEGAFIATPTFTVTGHVDGFDPVNRTAAAPTTFTLAVEKKSAAGTTSTAVPIQSDGTWSKAGIAIDEGENRITAAATKSGHRCFARIRVVRDTTSPLVTLSGVAPGGYVLGPAVLHADETERWPQAHVLSGTRTLSSFLGSPGENQSLSFDDASMTLESETPPSVRRLRMSGLAAEGDYDLRLRSTDRAGNVTDSAHLVFGVDHTPPVAVLGGVVHRSIARLTQLVTVSITDRNLTEAAVVATYDGKPDPDFACEDSDLDPAIFTATCRAAHEGAYEIAAQGTDRAGLVSPAATLLFTVDRTRPEVTFSGAAEGEVLAAAATVGASIADRHRDSTAETATLERDGVVIDSRSGPDFSFVIAVAGEYRLRVTATDLAGNSRSAERNFGLCLAPPVVAVEAPAAGAWLAAGAVALRGTLEGRFIDAVTVDPGGHAASFAAGAWVLPAFPLVEGANPITITAHDRAGREAAASVTVHHDPNPPLIEVASPTGNPLTSAPDLAVSAVASDANLDEVRLDGQVLARLGGSSAPYPIDRGLRLGEGDNEVVIEARDLAGNRASRTEHVTLDTRVDLLLVGSPGDGHETRQTSIVVRGTARDAHGLAVTVGGAAADRDGDAFSATVPLAQGENDIATVAIDEAGNQASVHTRVVVDATGPSLVTAAPDEGATGISPGQSLALEFDEEVELNGGLEVSAPGMATVEGRRVVYVASGGWPSDGTVTVALTAAVSDRAGNALANPRSWTFATADLTGPAAPTVVPALPASTALAAIEVCGQAEAQATVRVEGGVAPVEVVAGGDQHYCVAVGLERNVQSQLVVTARDVALNLSPATVAYVRQETVRPAVVSAVVIGPDQIRVVFSKPMECATVNATSVRLVDAAERPLSLTVDDCGGSEATVTSGNCGVDPVLLTVSTAATDMLGNPLAFLYSKLLNSTGQTFITGEVYDAGTGLRLPGATVEVVRIEGQQPPSPVLATTDAEGGFKLAVGAAGATWLQASKVGYAAVHRSLATQAGFATPVFDFRLTPLAAGEAALPPAGGVLSFAEGSVLVTVPPMSGGGTLGATPLSAQGLAARLPAGWTPVYAVDLRPALDFPGPATLRVPNRLSLVPGDHPQLVRFDLDTRSWVVELPPAVASDGRTLIGQIARTGSYAFVTADADPPPPPAVVGEGLPGVAPDDIAVGDLSAELVFRPETIFPSGQTAGQLSLSYPGETTSGLALQADVAERLQLFDDSAVELPTYVADLLLYKDGTAMPVKPQQAPGFDLYKEGHVRVKVYEFPDDVPQGSVIGADGGDAHQGAIGATLHVPEGAVDSPTPVWMSGRGAGELPLPILAPFDFAGAIELNLGGERLRKGAELSLAIDPAPPAGSRFVLLRAADLLGQQRWAYVAGAAYVPPGGGGGPGTLRSEGAEPGVREQGIYVFFRVHDDVLFGVIEGHVYDTAPPGAPVDGALVTTAATWPVGVSYESADEGHGWFTTVHEVSAPDLVAVTAESPFTRDRGTVAAAVPEAPPALVDIQLVAVAPRVVAMEPSDAASNVPLGTTIVLTFSEPVQAPTLAAGIAVLAGTAPVAGNVFALAGGMRAAFDPIVDLPPNAAIHVQVSGVLDLTGNPSVAYEGVFHTLDTVPPSRPAPGRVRVLAPEGGVICVEAPRLSDTVAVAVTNRTSGFSTSLGFDAGLNAYHGCLFGDYGDTITVSYVDESGNTASEDFGLFLELDAAVPTARVGQAGGRLAVADAEGAVEVTIAPDTFDDVTRVSLDPIAVADLRLPEPLAGFDVEQAFVISLEGKIAGRDIEVKLDPGGIGPDDKAFLVRMVEFGGRKLPELLAQMHLEDGKLVTRVPAIQVETSPTLRKGGGAGSIAGGEASTATDTDVQRVPGLRRGGEVALIQARVLAIGYFVAYGPYGAMGMTSGMEGFTDFIYQFGGLDLPGVFPLAAGQPFQFRIVDASTGRTRSTRTMPPVPADHSTTDTGSEVETGPLWVVATTPSRTVSLPVARLSERMAPGITLTAQGASDENGDDVPDGADLTLLATGDVASVPPGAFLRIHNSRSGAFVAGTAGDSGEFALAPIAARVGDLMVLAIEQFEVDPALPITVRFNRAVGLDCLQNGDLKLRDSHGFEVPVRVEGRIANFTAKPRIGLVLGEQYTLIVHVPTAEIENAPKQMAGPFEATFRTKRLVEQPTTPAQNANEMVKLGGLLFLAAGTAGLQVLDVSNPSEPGRQIGGLGMSGEARGIAIYRHDPEPPPGALYLAMCGGGDTGPGWLRAIDVSTPERLILPRIVGAETVSNRVGSTAEERIENLNEGRPIRVRTMRLWDGHETPPVQKDFAFVTTLGLGLGIFDLGLLPATNDPGGPPTARVSEYPLYGIQDVALLARHASEGSEAFRQLARWDVSVRFMSHQNEPDGITLSVHGAADGDHDDLPDSSPFGLNLAGTPDVNRSFAHVKLLNATRGRSMEGDVQPDGSFHLTTDVEFARAGDAIVVLVQNGTELLAVTAAGSQGVVILDVLNVHDPRLRGSHPLGGGVAHKVALAPGSPVYERCRHDGSGHEEYHLVHKDLAFVAGQQGGLYVLDLTDAARPQLVTRLTFESGVSVIDLALDEKNQRAVLNLGGNGLVLVNIARLLYEGANQAASVLGRIASGGGVFNTGLLTDVDLGMLWASAEGDGVVAARYELPRPVFVVEDVPGMPQECLDIIPRGLGMLPATDVKVALALPGGIGQEVYVDVQSLNAYGMPLRDPHWTVDGGALLTRVPRLKLVRRSDEIQSPDYNFFVSEAAIVFTADPRLRDQTRPTLVAGDLVRARLLVDPEGGELGWLSPDELARIETSIRSYRMDYVPGDNPAPAGGAGTGSGDVFNLLLHSGEFFHGETDLSVPGRMLGFAWSRHHRSQARYNGSLGRGWDSPYLARVRALPTGEVDYFNGAGDVRRFPRLERPAGPYFGSPPNVFRELKTDSTGFVLNQPSGTQSRFNLQGDLEKIVDLNGNTTELLRDGEGRLKAVRDEMGRYYRLAWDDQDRLHEVADFAGRKVLYAYDTTDQLITRTFLAPGTSLEVRYTYDTQAASKHALKTVINEASETWLDNTYQGGRVTTQRWGNDGETSTIAYDEAGRTATVTDRNGHWIRYEFRPGLPAAGGYQLAKVVEEDEGGEAVTEYYYDDQLRLETVIHPRGDRTQYEYEVYTGFSPIRDSNVTKETHSPPPGFSDPPEITSNTYLAPPNRLKESVDARGKSTTYTYDEHGNLATVTRPLGSDTSDTHYTYNAYGQVTQQTDPEQLVTELAYWPETMPGGTVATLPSGALDPATGGYLRSVTVDPAGLDLRSESRYDVLGRVSEATNAAGGKTLFEYDSRGLATKETRVTRDLRYEVSHTYDPRGFLDVTRYQHSGAGGEVVLDEDHDLLGFRTRLTATGPGLAAPVVTQWEPYPNRLLKMVTHPRGSVERFTYDDRDRLLEHEREHEGEGEGLSSTVKRGYDKNGNLLWESSPVNEAWRVEHTYDGHDRRSTSTTPDRLETRLEYWPGGLLRKETRTALAVPDNPARPADVVLFERSLVPSDLGFVTSETSGRPGQNPPEVGETLFAPDKLGRNLTVTDRRQKVTTYEYFKTGWTKRITDALQNVTEFTYHPLGGVETATRDGITTIRTHDALGRLLAVADHAGHTTRRTYDSRDNVLTSTDPLGNVTRYRYDALDRQVGVDGPQGETTRSGYDAEGHLLSYEDALHNVTSYEYDGFGRRTRVTYPGLAAYVYTFTLSDQVATETSPRGHVSTFTYEGSGEDEPGTDWLKRREVALGETVVDTELYTWDPLGRLTRVSNQAATVEREYNSFDRVTRDRVTVDGVAREVLRSYLLGQHPQTLQYPGGRTLAYTLDDLGRTDLITSVGTTLADYDWAGPSRLTKKTIGTGVEVSYGYDGEKMPQSRTYRGNGKRLVATSQEWTPRHEIRNETDVVRRGLGDRFTYDDAGRLTVAAYAAPASGDPTQAKRAFEYGLDAARNLTLQSEKAGGPYQLQRPAVVTTGNRYASFENRALAYDAEGNLTADGGARTYEYDWANRLTRVLDGGATIAAYGYDPLNRKVKRVAGTDTRYLSYDGWNLIEERDASGASVLEVIQGPRTDEPLSFTAADGIEHRLLADRAGSVLGLVDAQGKLEERYTYTPYGKLKRHAAPRLEQARFEGEKLVLRANAEVDFRAVTDEHAVTLSPSIDGEWALSPDGREFAFTPEDDDDNGHPDWPPNGASVSVTVHKALRGVTGLELAEQRQFSFVPSEAPDGLVQDWVNPAVEQVVQEADGKVVVLASEKLKNQNLPAAFTLREGGVSGTIPCTASLSPDGFRVTLEPNHELTPGSTYTLALVAAKLTDIADHTAAAATWTWTAEEGPTRVFDEGETSASQASLRGNLFFWQGRELDPATGLMDFRNRWYSPELGRWLTRDPLGYPDGPNQYAAFGGDPENARDPMGTYGLKCTPEGCTQMSDAAEWAILDAAGAPDSYKYSVVQQYSQEWDTVRSRAALMLSGYMAEAGLRQAGKMWLVGAGAAATGGLAAAGLTAAGVTTTTWGGTLLLGVGSGAVGGLGAQGTADLIEGQLSSPSAYLWSAGTGAALGGAFSAAGRGLSVPGGASLDLSSVEWGPQAIVINGRLPVLNPHFEPTPAMATEILAARTAAENARLAANPSLASTVLSGREYLAGQTNPRVAPMAYGNALERMTARSIRLSPLDSQLLRHVGGASNPDFVWIGPGSTAANFDITTTGQVRAHLRRPGYGPGLNVITYQRPPGFTVLP